MTNEELRKQSSSAGESSSRPEVHQETIQYSDGQQALELTGPEGSVLDWNSHKYSPTQHYDNEAIVLTSSGNGYYVATLYQGSEPIPVVVNIGATIKQDRLVAAENDSHRMPELPPVTLHRPWHIPDFYSTSGVEKVLLKYRKVGRGHEDPSARKTDLTGAEIPNPFAQYRELLKKYGYSEEPQYRQ